MKRATVVLLSLLLCISAGCGQMHAIEVAVPSSEAAQPASEAEAVPETESAPESIPPEPVPLPEPVPEAGPEAVPEPESAPEPARPPFSEADLEAAMKPPAPRADQQTITLKPLEPVDYPEALSFEDYSGKWERREENPVDEGFLAALGDFSYETAAALLDKGEQNANYSPLSLYYALAVAASGAAGETQEQLLGLLGVSDADALSQQCGRLFRRLYTDDGVTRLKLADSLWLDQNAAFREGFLSNAAEHFYAEAFSADFDDPQTGVEMGRWIADHTGGMLAPELETDPMQLLAILNTIYFYDQWSYKFDEGQTAPDAFHAPGGDVTVDFINGQQYGTLTKGEGFSRASLSLKGGGSMQFVLPDEGVSLSSLTASSERLEEALTGGEVGYYDIVWKLPKFSFGSSFRLKETLETLGVTAAFAFGEADFSGISEDPAFISEILQQTCIAVNELGVEAAAFTLVVLAGGGPPEPAAFTLDRPFLYAITAQNGAPIFIGVCADPTAG